MNPFCRSAPHPGLGPSVGLFVPVVAIVLAACIAAPGSPTPRSDTTPVPTVLPSPTATERGNDDPLPVPGQTILALQGTSDLVTGAFHADDHWSIAWRHDGRNLFSLQVIPAGVDTYGDLVVSAAEATVGTQTMYGAGDFVLKVFAVGRWSVTVADLVRAPRVSLPETIDGAGPGQTPLFETTGPWLLEWSTSAPEIGIELFPADGRGPWLLVDATRTTSGCVTQRAVGEFYLHVVAASSWELRLSTLEGDEVVCPI